MAATPCPSDPARLADLLFAGLAERPMWSRFRAALAEASGAAEVVLVIRSGPGAAETTIISAAGYALSPSDLVVLAALPGLLPVRVDLPAMLTLAPAPVLAVRVPLPDGMSAWLLLVGAPGWTEAPALALLAGLQRDLTRALPLYAAIAQSERARLVAEYALEASGIGVVVVEGDGTVLAVNVTAHGIMARTSLLRVRDGRLVAAASADRAALRLAVAAMARSQGPSLDRACHVPVGLADPGEGTRLTLIVRPGPPYGPVSAPLRRTAVIIVRDPAQPATLPPGDLAALFGLTPAEARLATRLADGEGLDEAALALGVTRNTARSQLQAIFAKTGVNRQGDLVRVLLGSAANHTSGGAGR